VSRTRLLRVSLVPAAALGAVALAAALFPPSGGGRQWARVERQDLVLGVAVDGELRAADSAELGPPQVPELWEFRIAFLAPEGAEVKDGEPVVGFDATTLEQRHQEQIAERDSAAAELERRTADLEAERSSKQLALAEARGRLRRAALKLAVPEELAPRHDLDSARIEHRLASLEIAALEQALSELETAAMAELAGMRGSRDRAAARVQELERSIEAMTVRAPRAGTVIYTANWRGEKKKVGDSVWRAETVVGIPDLSRMLADGEVAEVDSGRVAVGQRVTLNLEAHPDREYTGTVRLIRRSVQVKSRTNPVKVMKVEVALNIADPERMRPGMRFRGRVVTERIADVLTVPKAAISWRPEGPTVSVRTPLGRRRVSPTLGRRNADAFEVTAGLDAGDWVELSSEEVRR
jgi:HlyD family secretion protein